jgi:hypothetical protein
MDTLLNEAVSIDFKKRLSYIGCLQWREFGISVDGQE